MTTASIRMCTGAAVAACGEVICMGMEEGDVQ